MRLITNDLIKRRDYVASACTKLKRKMPYAPEGHLRVSKSNGCPQYYYIEKKGDTKGTYINNENWELAVKLVRKKYYRDVIKACEKETALLNELIELYNDSVMEDIYYSMNADRCKLISPLWLSDDEYAKKWLEQEYDRKGFRPEDPEHYTDKSERVRSKSEVMIANRLAAKGFPRIYELPLAINGKTIHPDFTVLNPRTREIFIWEHLGRMDDPQYIKDAIDRLIEYKKAGYYIGVNLIITFETSKHPLNNKEIDAMIDRYLV